MRSFLCCSPPSLPRLGSCLPVLLSTLSRKGVEGKTSKESRRRGGEGSRRGRGYRRRGRADACTCISALLHPHGSKDRGEKDELTVSRLVALDAQQLLQRCAQCDGAGQCGGEQGCGAQAAKYGSAGAAEAGEGLGARAADAALLVLALIVLLVTVSVAVARIAGAGVVVVADVARVGATRLALGLKLQRVSLLERRDGVVDVGLIFPHAAMGKVARRKESLGEDVERHFRAFLRCRRRCRLSRVFATVLVEENEKRLVLDTLTASRMVLAMSSLTTFFVPWIVG